MHTRTAAAAVGTGRSGQSGAGATVPVPPDAFGYLPGGSRGVLGGTYPGSFANDRPNRAPSRHVTAIAYLPNFAKKWDP